MCCGRCCATGPRSKLHLRLDIFIEIPVVGWRKMGREVSTHFKIFTSTIATLPVLAVATSENDPSTHSGA
jgi:hypothetical protein